MTTERGRQFHVRERLGQGGFGEVYRATMTSPGGLRSDTAVKILHNPTEDAVWRLRNEGRLLAQLRHPAILRVHDLARFGERTALVTEFVDGLDLGDAFALGLPLRAVVEAVGTVAEALDAAWSTVPVGSTEPLRLVHRDIKPSNLRIGHHGEVKVLDFGIAFAAEEGARDGDTRGTTMIGSLAYMAPERFARSVAHPAGDVYALGCTLFEGAVGARLHTQTELFDMVRLAASRDAHDQFVRERLSTIREPALAALLDEMLRFNPGERPSAGDVAARCEALVDALPGQRLKRWAAGVAWSAAGAGSGAMSGRIYTEGDAVGVPAPADDRPAGPAATADLSGPPPAATADLSGPPAAATADLSGPPPAATADLSGPPPAATADLSGPPPAATADLSGPPPAATADLSRPPRAATADLSGPPPAATAGLSGPAATAGLSGPAAPADPSRPPPSSRRVGVALGLAAAATVLVAAGAFVGGAFDAAPSEPGVLVVEASAPSAPPPAAAALPTAPAAASGPDVSPPSVAASSVAAPAATRPVTTPNSTRPLTPAAPARTAVPVAAPPVAAAAAPTPAPEPAEVPGRFAVVGDLRAVQLRNGKGSWDPGELPEGSYQIWAKFDGRSWQEVPVEVRIRAGATLSVRCNPVLWSCETL